MPITPESAQELRTILRETLRGKRLSAKLRQVDMAKRLGQYQSFVSKYESGERRLDVVDLVLVCDVLGVDALEILAEVFGRSKGG